MGEVYDYYYGTLKASVTENISQESLYYLSWMLKEHSAIKDFILMLI
jgi:hypothetical protein